MVYFKLINLKSLDLRVAGSIFGGNFVAVDPQVGFNRQ